jgi:hypothetical protein
MRGNLKAFKGITIIKFSITIILIAHRIITIQIPKPNYDRNSYLGSINEISDLLQVSITTMASLDW